MKLIHCADLHLDSRMTANLTKEKTKERRTELLRTFEQMIRYGEEHQAEGVIIAGDLFDTKQVSATARNTVKNAVINHPEMTFFYLRGNHDAAFLKEGESLPDNLKTFGQNWTTYTLGDSAVTVTGVELDRDNSASVYSGLSLDKDRFNIVVMHGQESGYSPKDGGELIDLKKLKNLGIDYLALGHIHFYKEAQLDGRGCYCYPGCLEGRGFDECGEHGFVLLEIDEKNRTATRKFVPMARRNFYAPQIDISGCATTGEIACRIEEVLNREQYPPESLVKIVLTGSVPVDCEKNTDILQKKFEEYFYFLKIQDQTKFHVDYEAYGLDASLKGEFVRTVREAKDLSAEEKAAVIRMGIQILSGEEPE